MLANVVRTNSRLQSSLYRMEVFIETPQKLFWPRIDGWNISPHLREKISEQFFPLFAFKWNHLYKETRHVLQVSRYNRSERYLQFLLWPQCTSSAQPSLELIMSQARAPYKNIQSVLLYSVSVPLVKWIMNEAGRGRYIEGLKGILWIKS